VHAQQQRHVGQPLDQYLDTSPDERLEPLDGAAVARAHVGGRLFQTGQRPVEGEPEKRVLARDVVVDRRLADADVLGEVFHARAVEPALVEQRDTALQDRFEVQPGPAAPARERLGHRRNSLLRPRNSATTSSRRRTVTS
jgi:hypothetical protein